MSHDAGDFFEFEVARGKAVEVDPDHPLQRAISIPVVARIGGTTFAHFSIDLALPREDELAVEWVQPEATLTGEPAVDEIPPVALLALPAQIADKVCAIFERYGDGRYTSSRARDLADIAMVATQQDIDGTELTEHLRREERRRQEAGTLIEQLPQALRLANEQIADWRPRWRKATRGAPIDFDEAQAVAASFIDPVLRDLVAGKRWSAADQAWTSP